MSPSAAPRDPPAGVFLWRFTVPAAAMDQNGHVNNVVYIQWMQEAAIRHSEACGGTAAMRALGCTWVVRSHQIEYLSPAFANDTIEAATWVVNFRRVRSLRRYRFSRPADARLLAEGSTDWVFVDAATGRPRAIPVSVSACFPVVPDGA
jgi:acyl-CoA thioester hydrolase